MMVVEWLDIIKSNLFVFFLVAFGLFYVTFIQKESVKTFFVIILFMIFAVYWSQHKNKEKAKQTDIDMVIDSFEKDLPIFQPEIDNHNVYKIHKPPSTLKYIKKNDYVKKMLFDLRPMLIFDKTSFVNLIVYMEYFLKYHYFIIVGYYDSYDYLPILKDIRKEILNFSKSFVFNSPDLAILEMVHNNLQAFTFRYLQIIKHKYNSRNKYDYDPPYEYDSKTDHIMF